jgi:hypothetical protein
VGRAEVDPCVGGHTWRCPLSHLIAHIHPGGHGSRTCPSTGGNRRQRRRRSASACVRSWTASS